MAQDVPGTLKVSNNCIADLVGRTALECYGVVGMAALDQQDGFMHLLPMYRMRKGIDVDMEGGKPVVCLHVIVERDLNLQTVAKNIISAQRFVLKKIAELDDVDIRVCIEGMRAR